MRNIFLSLLFIFTLFSCTNNQNEEIVAVDYGIIPQPKSIVSHGSNFTLSEKVVIVVKESGKEMLFTAKYLKKRINLITGIELTISDKEDSTGKNIVLVNSSYNNSSSAYQLDITKNNILISGENAGVFYGVQSLLQIINKNKNNLPTCTIDDSSRFEWRGMHLDESRHFFGVGEVKKYIDLIAMYKLNVFHWHLTDDQGWRIEIKSHPKLTEVGAWREGTGKEIWSYDIKPATEGKPKYGGFYTQEQIKEVIEYASERFVTIIPEIELPGHSWSALSAYPELSCSGKLYEKPKDIYFQFTDPYCAGNEQTFDLLEDVLTEVFDLFPSEYVHIGGDECKKSPWEECTKCQNRMHEESIKNVEELQSYFIKRIERFASSKGKKIIGWDEIMEGGLPKEAVVMSWTGTENGIKAATLGYNTIMIPQQFTYLDSNQDISIPSPGNVLVLKDVYDYNPAPDTLSENISKNIIGVQAAIWTETVYSNAILETVLLPRLTAISEVAWSENENKNWDNYLSRLENQLSFFDLLGVNYFIQSPYGLQDNIFTGDKVDVNLTSPYKSATIRYTINGDTPTIDSKIFAESFTVVDGDTVKAVTFLPNGKSSNASEGVFKKTLLLKSQNIEGLKSGLNLKISLGNISTLDDFSTLTLNKELVVDKIVVPNDSKLVDDYGLEFNGYINIEEDGVFTFYTASDDGSRLYIDGNLIVDNDGIHGLVNKTGIVALEKGTHYIKLLYFQGNYGAELEVGIKNEQGEQIQLSDFFIKQNM